MIYRRRSLAQTLRCQSRVWIRRAKLHLPFPIHWSHRSPHCHQHQASSQRQRSSTRDSSPWELPTQTIHWPTSLLRRHCTNSATAARAHHRQRARAAAAARRRSHSKKLSRSRTFKLSIIRVRMFQRQHKSPYSMKQRNWKNHDRSTKLIISWTCNSSTRRVMWPKAKDRSSRRAAAKLEHIGMCYQWCGDDEVWKACLLSGISQVSTPSSQFSSYETSERSGYLAYISRVHSAENNIK